MRALWIIALVALAGSAEAQETDKDFLTSFLEENLSSAGRTVTITGFQGALSSKATMAEMTIADDQGVWLTVRDVTLDWSRSSLLSGQIVINEFSAGDILLDRMPETSGGPAAEAGSFALPDLPVSVDVKTIAARHIALGPTVLGQVVEGQLVASMQLAGGEGAARLDLTRSDAGPAGQFHLTAAYQRATTELTLSLSAIEGAGGVAVSLLGVPGRPSAALVIEGRGPLAEFAAEISLKTDDVTRLAGRVQLTASAEGRGFTADLSGDPTPVFLPHYAAFFGPDVTLHAKGQRLADGTMDLSEFSVATQALMLDGHLRLDADLVPLAFGLNGKLGLPGGSVVLPLATNRETRLYSGTLTLNYDRASGDDWLGSASLQGLDHAGFDAEAVRLSGAGHIARTAAGAVFDGQFDFDATGLTMADPGLAQALGTALSGQARVDWTSGSAMRVSDLGLRGAGFNLTTTGTMGDIAAGLALTGTARGAIDNLALLSLLAGRDLRGSASFDLAGTGNLMTGFADVTGALRGKAVATGAALLDGMLAGDSAITLALRRDETGTRLRRLDLAANGIAAALSGMVTSDGANLAGDLTISDLAVLGPGYGGGMRGKVALTGPLDGVLLTLDATGRDLRLGQTQADLLLRGASHLTAALDLSPDGTKVRDLSLTNSQMRLAATGTLRGGVRRLTVEHRILDLGQLYPQFPGVLVSTGLITQSATGTTLDLTSKGPGQIDARITGQLSPGFRRVDLAIRGTASAGLANKLAEPRSLSGPLRFDLRMQGPIALASLSGPVTISGGRVADPGQNFGLTDVAGTAQLSGGLARVSVSAGVTSAGDVGLTGTIGLVSPYIGDLALALNGVGLRDPDLYSTRVEAALTVKGPVLGAAQVAGTVNLGWTELRIPSTGFSADGALAGLRHVGEPDVSRDTRHRARMLEGGPVAAGGGSGYGLNLRVNAPNQVFIRGRGLDAELGGALTLRGRTDAIVPSGAFNLIRGRLDILGRRLNLSEALLQLQGAMVPFVRLVASVDSDGIVASVLIEGDANDPKVSFTSNPELPQEEVLARLLFDRGLDNLTAFQAIQLGGAVATLAGKGGEGLIGNLRKRAGFDNLDITADESGEASVTVGKYITDKAYSEATVSQGGKSSVSINLDLAPHITLKGHLDQDGQTGIGVFLQRDY